RTANPCTPVRFRLGPPPTLKVFGSPPRKRFRESRIFGRNATPNRNIRVAHGQVHTCHDFNWGGHQQAAAHSLDQTVPRSPTMIVLPGLYSVKGALVNWK